jgi:hypothetical protein
MDSELWRRAILRTLVYVRLIGTSILLGVSWIKAALDTVVMG